MRSDRERISKADVGRGRITLVERRVEFFRRKSQDGDHLRLWIVSRFLILSPLQVNRDSWYAQDGLSVQDEVRRVTASAFGCCCPTQSDAASDT